MPRLIGSVRAWGTPGFRDTLRGEIEALGAAGLPLQQGLTKGSYAVDRDLQASILGVDEGPGALRVRAGLFYAGVIAGCSCADDPTPVEEQPEYCEVEILIDRATGEATLALVSGEG